MTSITLIKQNRLSPYKNFGSFLINPLEPGQATTLGNSIRRTLLTNTIGTGITAVSVNDSNNEFDSIWQLREDILELVLNLKEIVFTTPLFLKKNNLKSLYGSVFAKGPKIITSNLIMLPKNEIKILNPNCYICTITADLNFKLETILQAGKGFAYANEEKILEHEKNKKFFSIDTNFSPIKKVYYNVELIYNNKGLLKESLAINFFTNGSISPLRSMCNSIKALIKILYPLLNNIKLITKKKIYDHKKIFRLRKKK